MAAKYKEGDTVFINNKEWTVDSVNEYLGVITYDLKKHEGHYYQPGEYRRNVPAEKVHHLSLIARLARIEAALNLD